MNTSFCIHEQVNLCLFRCYMLRLLSIFFQLMKLVSHQHLPWLWLWAHWFYMCTFCIFKPVQGRSTTTMSCRCCVLTFSPSQALSLTLSPSPGICVTMAQNQQLWKHCHGANTRGRAPTPQMCCWLDPPPWRGDRFWSCVGIQNSMFLSSLWLEEIPHSLVQYLI